MKKIKILILSIFAVAAFSSCSFNRVKPNYEGVLMSNYGRAGIADFKKATGAQGILGPGTELYQVPMWEQKADPSKIEITTGDGGVFTADPTYTYQAKLDSGAKIIFHYKWVGVDDTDNIMDNIEAQVLNSLVLNAYKEQARNYSTDSLLTHQNDYENAVQTRLEKEFARKYFDITMLTSGLKPPQSMTDKIQAMNNAKIETQTVKNQLQTATMLQERARIEAKTHEIQSVGLTKEVLQQQWIDAIRHSQNRIIITDGRTPVILGQ